MTAVPRNLPGATAQYGSPSGLALPDPGAEPAALQMYVASIAIEMLARSTKAKALEIARSADP